MATPVVTAYGTSVVTAYDTSSVSLAWNANSESDVAGYRIRYGTASGSYTQQVDVGMATTGMATNLADGTLYFIVVTAYNTVGLESPPSNELSYLTPPGPPPSPTPTPTPSPSVTPNPSPTTTPSPAPQTPTPTPPVSKSPTPTPPPVARKHLLNVATRTFVENGEDVMIGGFIISGTKAKKVIIRAIGPTLAKAHVPSAMADPVLKLYNSKGTLITSNDNWTSRRKDVQATKLAPGHNREAALVTTLRPGNYTCVVQSKTGTPGVALFELYDLNPANSQLVNISTRGKVGIGDRVLIGGFIIGGDQPTKVLVRAIGPSLAKSGISNMLRDPMLELHGATGALIFANNDWRSSQQQQIKASTIPPTDNKESAIIATLKPGNYTAIVRGAGNSTGVALVEVYNLQK